MAPAEEASAFMEALTKSPQLKVLSVMAERPQDELTKTEIAQKAGIGRTTLYRVWDDLERMKAITPSRNVGAVTLYRLNPQSPVVQSLLNITRSLTAVTAAVGKMEEIKELERAAREEFGKQIPMGPSSLVKLIEASATEKERAVDMDSLKLSKEEKQTLESLIDADLVERLHDKYFLTPLGVITARGAAKIWKEGEAESVEKALSSAKVALDLINQEIKRLESRISK